MSELRNATRRSSSIPRRLVRDRALHLLPAYYLLSLSDLGREAIRHSGSYRFADHIYRGTPSGRSALGRRIDAWLLGLPAARAFRCRCTEAKRTMLKALESRSGHGIVRVLAVPCGIPRDLVELASEQPSLVERIDYHGMDLDPLALADARMATAACGIKSSRFHCGNALVAADYPSGPFDCVVSTGFTEFLSDLELARFFAHIHGVLSPGGVFFTSASVRDPLSARLLEMVELVAQYRTAKELAEILQQTPWRRVGLKEDATGLQTFVTLVK